MSTSQSHAAFEDLPQERQDALIDAGLRLFGRYGYKGASTEDIAHRAGMSKGLLFFYFRNKQALYIYLMETLTQRITAYVADEKFYVTTDFFDLLLYVSREKSTFMQDHPYVLEFAIRAFYPEHRDTRTLMNSWNQNYIEHALELWFSHVNFTRFRSGVDPQRVLEMLIWMGDGYLHQVRSRQEPLDINAMLREFELWCEIMRQWAYKPEHLASSSDA